MNKSRNYYRPSTVTLHKAKRRTRRQSGTRFFLRLLILLSLLGLVLAGGYWGARQAWRLVSQTRWSDWQVKSVVVNGLDGELQQAVKALAAPHQGKSFTMKEAESLRHTVQTRYPMLKNVSVRRGLFSGKLTVSAAHRTPLAKFVRPDGNVQYIDADSTVYTDAHPLLSATTPTVELEGRVPEKLSTEFIELVESMLKLEKQLPFSSLRMNLTDNTVDLLLSDGTELQFGPAVALKKKALRGVQILDLARKKYKGPFVLRFQYFESGKVFLTQKGL